MSNRPQKNKKKVVVEDEHAELEYRPPGKTSKDIIVQIGVVILIMSFVLAPMLVFVLSSSSPEPPQEQKQAQQIDDTDSQIQLYAKQLQANPDDATALANLGYYTTMKAANMPPTPETETQRMTLLAEAEVNLRKALEKDPSYGFAQTELGRNLLLQKNYDEANTFISQALKSAEEKSSDADEKVANDGKNQKAELLRLSAGILLEQGKSQEAVAKFNEVVELKPGDASLYLQRSQLHRQIGDMAASREDLVTAVDIGQKTQNQQVVMIGQAMLEELDRPAVTATPGAPESVSTPAPAAPSTPVPAPAVTSTPVVVATPAPVVATPTP